MTARDESLLVVSAHFDDAVLSVGGVIQQHPGTIVLTVFGGRPPKGMKSHAWDRDTGCELAAEAVDARADEDLQALGHIGAHQRRLRFLDAPYRTDGIWHENQYLGEPLPRALSSEIGKVLDDIRPSRVLLPLGNAKWHTDHHATSEATLVALTTRRWCRAIVYADLPYALAQPRPGKARQKELRSRGISLVPYLTETPPSSSTKTIAVKSYKSQVQKLEAVNRRAYYQSLTAEAERCYHLQFPDPCT